MCIDIYIYICMYLYIYICICMCIHMIVPPTPPSMIPAAFPETLPVFAMRSSRSLAKRLRRGPRGRQGTGLGAGDDDGAGGAGADEQPAGRGR